MTPHSLEQQVDEILKTLNRNLDHTITRIFNGVKSGQEEWKEDFTEAKQTILALLEESIDRKRQYDYEKYKAEAKQAIALELNKAEERGRAYKLNQDLKKYLGAEKLNTLIMVQSFAYIFIAVMCLDTNSTSAEITLKDLKIRDKSVGTWKVKATLKAQKPERKV